MSEHIDVSSTQTITGVKTFTNLGVSTPTSSGNAASKAYVDSLIATTGNVTYGAGVPGEVSATGGTLVRLGGYNIHTFTTSGTFTVLSSGNVEVLVVAGGGGGGAGAYSSGGGAGGMVEKASHAVSTGAYSVVVGAGGVGNINVPTSGGNSSFDSIIGIGGGGGRSYNYAADQQGGPGGSGGGGCSNSGLAGVKMQGDSNGGTGYGNNGGAGSGAAGGGGGGAGGAGATPTAGAGRSNSITGSAVTYAAGGVGVGAAGGGGSGAANTGNGAQGGGGALGGSGVVIIKYASGGAPATTPTTVGQVYIDTVAKRKYYSVGTSSSADWMKEPAYYQNVLTVTGGGGDKTANIPFDWSGGFLKVIITQDNNDWADDTADRDIFIHTSYDCLKSGGYATGKHILGIGHASATGHSILSGVSSDPGTPSSATPNTIVFHDDGATTVYVRYYVWA